jgi:hypothetical protein
MVCSSALNCDLDIVAKMLGCQTLEGRVIWHPCKAKDGYESHVATTISPERQKTTRALGLFASATLQQEGPEPG